MKIEFSRRIFLPEDWDQKDQTESSLPKDSVLENRVLAAVAALADITFKENLQLAHRNLVQLGLVPLCDGDGPLHSLQVYLAKKIARLLALGGVRFRIDKEEFKVPRSEILFYIAAMHFDVEICVFSTRRRPHVYRPRSQPRCSIGLFWAMDTFTSLSDILPLICTKTKPTWSVPSENRIILYPKYPAASFRDAPRARTRQVAKVDDGDALIQAW